MPADVASPGPAAAPGPLGPSAQGPGVPVAASGVIHDLGYRRYDGKRLGRAQIARALCWHSLRSAFGIGRGVKAKIVPMITFGIMCLPAIINAVAVAVSTSHARIIPYDTYVPALRVLVMTVFIAAQAPELVSRDLRSHVLPLYFARPAGRADVGGRARRDRDRARLVQRPPRVRDRLDRDLLLPHLDAGQAAQPHRGTGRPGRRAEAGPGWR